ncbi:hypothetical protein CEXT_645081 [Caerostris extrusa]|uniref:Uncharacterized protein n=1 Tax=Caerostris extrusa TaxID=172846 RepID=A0AAV4WNC6_CAEEX|nr:hypothetical protein CEXT_645081 [Caerostris extrusa]
MTDETKIHHAVYESQGLKTLSRMVLYCINEREKTRVLSLLLLLYIRPHKKLTSFSARHPSIPFRRLHATPGPFTSKGKQWNFRAKSCIIVPIAILFVAVDIVREGSLNEQEYIKCMV